MICTCARARAGLARCSMSSSVCRPTQAATLAPTASPSSVTPSYTTPAPLLREWADRAVPHGNFGMCHAARKLRHGGFRLKVLRDRVKGCGPCRRPPTDIPTEYPTLVPSSPGELRSSVPTLAPTRAVLFLDVRLPLESPVRVDEGGTTLVLLSPRVQGKLLDRTVMMRCTSSNSALLHVGCPDQPSATSPGTCEMPQALAAGNMSVLVIAATISTTAGIRQSRAPRCCARAAAATALSMCAPLPSPSKSQTSYGQCSGRQTSPR
jgi:hypothetical protein